MASWPTNGRATTNSISSYAGYAIPGASIKDIEYLPDRKLDKSQILRLASCTYIQEAHNVILLGATGAGKTYIAYALGMAANRNFYNTKYIRLPDLLVEITMARGDGTYREYMKKLKKTKLLILDEWLIMISNHALLTKSKDKAFEKRIVAVPFCYSVPEEEQNPDLLKALDWEKDAVASKATDAYYRRGLTIIVFLVRIL